jgi:hypothetical protein
MAIGIFLIEPMPALAVRLRAVTCARKLWIEPPKGVHALRHGLQMIRVNTSCIAAKVVHNATFRNLSHKEEI